MSKERDTRADVTDSEIESIIARGSAEITELVAAQEPIERNYLQSVEAGGPIQEGSPVISCTGTVEER